MKKHSGMRPQDIVVLLTIIAQGGDLWMMKDIAQEAYISASEVTESLNRSAKAGLVDKSKKKVMRHALLEFLTHGLRYVFPQEPGAIVRGVPTAFSASPLDKLIMSNEKLVWPYAKGKERGQSVEPLYPSVVEAALNKPELYELLALVDALRVGRVRERELANKELEKRILNGR
ncbi:MarR family transcriptional regulator [Pontibacter beigongshangensis]|uniref:MarR family transcriptional regulator n=1 Tax=Pontibacter beigongshangensis TaxID=2574733 RepID=UPI001F5079F8|nr:helix-turn-helix domain-containing protein [Pontibacter beigongshangensis]